MKKDMIKMAIVLYPVVLNILGKQKLMNYWEIARKQDKN